MEPNFNGTFANARSTSDWLLLDSANGTVSNLTDTDSAVLYIAGEALLGLTAIVGNLFVIVAILASASLKTSTNYLIFSLAVADFLVGVCCMPMAIASYLGHPRSSFYGCLFMNTFILIVTQISVANLLVIAVERFTAISDPFRYSKLWTDRFTIVTIAITWVLSALLGLIPMMGWHNDYQVLEECSFTAVIDMHFMVYFNFFGCILVPLTCMSAIYLYIFKIVRGHIRRDRLISQQLRQSRVSRPEATKAELGKNYVWKKRHWTKELKAAKTLGGVVFFFALCWIPLHLLNALSLLCGDTCRYPRPVLLVAIFMSHANSSLNPVLYAYSSKDMKVAIHRLMCCNRPQAARHTRSESA